MKGLGFLGDGYQPKAMELPGAPVSIWAGWESRSDPGVRAGLQAEGRQCAGQLLSAAWGKETQPGRHGPARGACGYS